MKYHFFDYKWNIPGFQSDLFSTQHLIYIVLVFVLAPILACCLRKISREKIERLLKILAIATIVLEITKVSWESYYDITTGRGFNWEGLLPIYSCSLYIYTLFCAAFFKGRVKETALAFLSTIGMLFGGIGVIYCNGLNYYPFWTFGAFYSLYFHSAMFCTGLFLLISGYQKPSFRMVPLSFIPILLLSLVAIPVNYALGADYMSLYSGSSIPLYEDLAAFLASHGLRPIYTAIMLLTHLPLAALVVSVSSAIAWLCARVKSRREKRAAPPSQSV